MAILKDFNPVSNADVLIQIADLPDIYFSKFSGVKLKLTRPTFSDGLSNQKRKAASGSFEWQNVTLNKAYDPKADKALFAFLDGKVGGTTFSMTATPVRRALDPATGYTNTVIGGSWKLSGCRLEGYEVLAGTDTAGGDSISEVMIELSVENCTSN